MIDYFVVEPVFLMLETGFIKQHKQVENRLVIQPNSDEKNFIRYRIVC
jgi:hypothetical protein